MCLMLGFLQVAEAQLRIGLRFEPAISYNRVRVVTDSLRDFSSVASLLPVAGLFFEFEPSERYHIVLDVAYQPRHLRYHYERLLKGQTEFVKKEEHQKLQYLTLGVGIKLLTDELFPKGRAYFMTSPHFALKLEQRPAEQEASVVEQFLVNKATFADISLRFLTGIELDIALQTAFFAGISYERSLIDMLNQEQNLPQNTDIDIKNDRIGLSVGIKF